MKKCTVCKKSKSLDQFNNRKKNKDGKNNKCKSCKRAYDNKYYAEKSIRREQIKKGRKNSYEQNKDFLIQYLLNNPCVDCGENDPFFLEFDHVSGDKKDCVTNLTKYGKPTLIREIKKCEVRCIKCHRIATAKRAGWYDSYNNRVATLAQLAEQSFCKAQVASSTLAGGFGPII